MPHDNQNSAKGLTRLVNLGSGGMQPDDGSLSPSRARYYAASEVDALLASREPKGEDRPIPWSVVVAAIEAVQSESSRRGSMYPQVAEEHEEDRKATQRVIEGLGFFGKGCESVKGWPTLHPAPKLPTEVGTVIESGGVRFMRITQEGEFLPWIGTDVSRSASVAIHSHIEKHGSFTILLQGTPTGGKE